MTPILQCSSLKQADMWQVRVLQPLLQPFDQRPVQQGESLPVTHVRSEQDWFDQERDAPFGPNPELTIQRHDIFDHLDMDEPAETGYIAMLCKTIRPRIKLG